MVQSGIFSLEIIKADDSREPMKEFTAPDGKVYVEAEPDCECCVHRFEVELMLAANRKRSGRWCEGRGQQTSFISFLHFSSLINCFISPFLRW